MPRRSTRLQTSPLPGTRGCPTGRGGSFSGQRAAWLWCLSWFLDKSSGGLGQVVEFRLRRGLAIDAHHGFGTRKAHQHPRAVFALELQAVRAVELCHFLPVKALPVALQLFAKPFLDLR